MIEEDVIDRTRRKRVLVRGDNRRLRRLKEMETIGCDEGMMQEIVLTEVDKKTNRRVKKRMDVMRGTIQEA